MAGTSTICTCTDTVDVCTFLSGLFVRLPALETEAHVMFGNAVCDIKMMVLDGLMSMVVDSVKSMDGDCDSVVIPMVMVDKISIPMSVKVVDTNTSGSSVLGNSELAWPKVEHCAAL